ncbi:hypothetical protein [Nocardioides sp. SYSU D00038]|uniref:hypothetical protein n=1 Tax=Nocardioides sp. SYSU D00038 TaxID=2812554 RepID=UPI001967274E|nr:hypothetical protein [Nocardioides sp. SYSU D00038]
MRRLGAALWFAALLFAASACGSEDDGATGVASLEEPATADESGDDGDGDGDGGDETKSAEEQALAFAQCMRENGVDMPDPQVDEDGRLQLRAGGGPGKLPDEATLEAAQEACADLRPDFGGELSPEDRSEMQDRVLAFAQCMRDNGIDMPDPDFQGGMVRFGPPEGVDPEDPAFREAQETCMEESGMDQGMRP